MWFYFRILSVTIICVCAGNYNKQNSFLLHQAPFTALNRYMNANQAEMFLTLTKGIKATKTRRAYINQLVYFRQGQSYHHKRHKASLYSRTLQCSIRAPDAHDSMLVPLNHGGFDVLLVDGYHYHTSNCNTCHLCLLQVNKKKAIFIFKVSKNEFPGTSSGIGVDGVFHHRYRQNSPTAISPESNQQK